MPLDTMTIILQDNPQARDVATIRVPFTNMD